MPRLADAAGAWTPLTRPAPGGVALMLLLSDGTVMCQNSGNTGWYRLTPNLLGSYVNGTWTTQAPMHDSRRYYGSQVLRDGRVYCAGGEYGTGGGRMEIYDSVANTWTTPVIVPNAPIDSCTETLPGGDVLQGNAGSDTRVYDVTNGVYSAAIMALGGQDEPSWVKLQDGSILTLTGTTSERFVPSLNRWVADANLPVTLFGYGYEIGAALLLPTGKLFYIGGTSNTAIYTPWTTNADGLYTPAGTTNAGTWAAGPNIPNNNGAVDAPAAMMVNGSILCCMANTTTNFGTASTFYEYDSVANTFTQINGPTGSASFGAVAYGCTMLDLPDGTVLFSSGGSQLYSYRPSGPPLASGVPVILGASTNQDGSFHLTGTLFNGISEGAAYGDDSQMNSGYPVARITNSSGNVLYCRTYNWSTCNVMTGTNLVSTEMTLPNGLLAGTYSLFVTANGISSAAYPLTIAGTPLSPVTGLAFSTIASNRMAFYWNDIGSTETGYLVQRSADGVNYSTVASLGGNITNGTDTAVTPLGQYYYRVLGTNAGGPGLAAPPIFAASLPVVPVPAPWQNQDVGAVLGSGAAGANAGTFTLIGSGSGIGKDDDQFQFVAQPIAGDVTLTARVLAGQNTGVNALAGVMIRNGLGNDAADVLMALGSGSSNTVLQSRAGAGAWASGVNGFPGCTAPYWVRLVRSGNAVTGYASSDGVAWTPQGTSTAAMEPVVYAGLAVGSGAPTLLNTAAFDSLTITGVASANPIPLSDWKLDETAGATATDCRGGNDGTCNNVALGLPGATPDTGAAAGFNGTNADISIPPLNLNSNVLTLTAWVNRTGDQNAWSGLFFNRANSTVAGLHFGTANELRYTWNNSASTYNWNSGLIVPNQQWTFVALIIEPARARIFIATNGVLWSATNNVANAVQAFDGTSSLGLDDSSSSRRFCGLLDEVQFYNRVLTPAQLAQLAAPPVVTFAAPASGAYFAAPATVSLLAAVSGASGHTLNQIQYFMGNTLVGQSASGPAFGVTVTNLASGSYQFTARLFYDAGGVVASGPLSIIVSPPPGEPQNVAATALASNSVWVSWSPAPHATGYVLSRGGTPQARLSGVSYLDTGLVAGSNYCYSVVATNPSASSATSASSCVTTPGTGATLAWDAGASPIGPQDGSDFWGSSAATWWTGSANGVWADNSLAVFGSGTVTNCIVTLTNLVTPSGLVFSATGGGSYSVTNAGGAIVLSGTPAVAAYENATIGAVVQGAGALVKSGAGCLTLSALNTFSGGTTINEGTLQLGNAGGIGKKGSWAHGFTLRNGVFDINGQTNYVTGNLGAAGRTWLINAEAITLGGQSGGAMTVQDSGGTGSGFCTYNLQNCIIYNAANHPGPATISAPWLGTGQSGVGVLKTITVGQSTNSGGVELDFTGPLSQNSGNDGANSTIQKTGAGTLRISAANYFPYIQITAGKLVVNHINALGATRTQNGTANNLVTVDGGTLDLNGFSPSIGSLTNGSVNTGVILNNGTSGSTFTVGTSDASAAFAGRIMDGTSATALVKSGGGSLTLSGANTYTGPTTVSNGALVVNGSLAAASVVTVAANARLAGSGTISGPTTIQPGGTIQPGLGGNNLSALTLSNSLTLSGNALFALNKTSAPMASQISGLSSVNYGGALIVTNLGSTPLVEGDSFVLFSAGSYHGSFRSQSLPALATNLAWDVSPLPVNGSIVVAALPVITRPPLSLTVNLGSPAAFSVGATGSPPLACQWRKNGVSLPGGTAATYNLASAAAADAADYSVVVTNHCGSVTSLVATLTVYPRPSFASVDMMSNGTFRLNVAGGAGQTFILLSASNLVPPLTWWPLATNSAGSNGLSSFSDAQAAYVPQRFYRLMTP